MEETSVVCPSCGKVIKESDEFCKYCGARRKRSQIPKITPGFVAMWVLTGIMAFGAIRNFPSFATIFSALFVAFAIPIPAVQDFWAGFGMKKWMKTGVLIMLFFVAIAVVPTTGQETPADHSSTGSPEDSRPVEPSNGNLAQQEVTGTPYTPKEDPSQEDDGIWANKFTPIDDFRYTLDKNEKTITLVRYSGNDKKIMLSPVYTIGGEDYKLTSLGNDACFFGKIQITSIYIPEGVTYFGDSCFNSCSDLKYLYIPSTANFSMGFVDYIGEHTLFCESSAFLPGERDTNNYEEHQDDMSQAEEMGSNVGGAINGILSGMLSSASDPIVTEIYFGGTSEQWESHQ